MKILRNIFFVLALLALVSCDKVKKYPWNDAWNNVETPVDPESPDKPTDPETPTDPENPTDPETPTDPEKPTEPEKPIERVGKARMVWIDAAANFKDYANSKSTIESDMQRLKDVGFTLSHGYAVAIGMHLIAKAAEKKGIAQAGLAESIRCALEKNGLPVSADYTAEEITEGVLKDKKRRGGEISFVFPEKIGLCRLVKIPVAEVTALIRDGLE